MRTVLTRAGLALALVAGLCAPALAQTRLDVTTIPARSPLTGNERLQFVDPTGTTPAGRVGNTSVSDLFGSTVFGGQLPVARGGTGASTAAAARTALGAASGASNTGTNTGDQTISLTGDVVGSGTGSFAAAIQANAVTNAKAAQMAAGTLKGNASGSSASPADLTAQQAIGVLQTGRAYFSAHNNGVTFTVPASAVQQQIFGTTNQNNGSYFNTTTGRFTPPAGVYQVTVQFTFASGVSDQAQYTCAVFKNGASVGERLMAASGTGQQSCDVNVQVSANGSDYFMPILYNGGGGTLTVSGSAVQTFFLGRQL